MKTDIHELLKKLDLTEYESKTLNTLFQLKEEKAPEISRDAQVPKTRVYDVLDGLVAKGLVIEIQGRPKKYRIVEPSKALTILMENKKEEMKKLQQHVEDLKEQVSSTIDLDDEEEKVLKVKDQNDFMRILEQELRNAKNSVITFTEKTVKHNALKRALQEAKQRNVHVKMLHSNKDDDLSHYEKHGVEIKHVEHGLEAFIIDDKKLVLALSDLKKEKPEYHFTIWNKSPMVPALAHYFEKHWNE